MGFPRASGAGRTLSVAGVVLGVLAVVVAIVFWRTYATEIRTG
ncbi:hypothetical protein [Petropleomorpha daqingensis]|uniref:Putative membrane protein YqjE n=1 Tax=Petropleomorpha daqingensis TaxID=2026353 RepID=A0A853CGR6_9ACTN|nr:hypothetical protein [Petropleomorpha daqingensis]NYJ05742.1 putative membrane protein YqjE [Petropleomorpha daqingensis]